MKRTIRTLIIWMLSVLLMLSAGPVSFGDTVLIGDVDGDGEITPQDANCITRYLAHFENLDASQRGRADFDGDGEITSRDATMILSAVLDTNERVKTRWNVSMIVTSDMKGEAWGSNTEEKTGYSSALNLATFVREERKKDPDVLLIDAGGSLFGSAISDEYVNYTNKRIGPMTRIFMDLAYDAALLGPEAVTYSSQMMRNDMEALAEKGTAVLGANVSKLYPLITDPDPALWNDILPCKIIEVSQGDERSVRVGLIGMVEPDLASGEDEAVLTDPLKSFEAFKSQWKDKCDISILIYYGNVEGDESQESVYPVRKLLRQISDVDLVLVAHGSGEGVRTEHDGHGKEVPIISLPDGVEYACKLSVAECDDRTLVLLTQKVDTSRYAPDEELQKQIKPYVNAVSEMMDARIGTLTERIEPFSPDTHGMTDGMELLHEMQIWNVKQWLGNSDLDLPQNYISIAYPYLGTTGLNAGAVRYRDICAMHATVPRYTLLLVRGAEIRAWLTDYAKQIASSKSVYSLYGLSYLLNTMNPETPLGYLEYSSGREVEDDEIFTLILADNPEEESILLPYLDETWMTYEDRVVDSFEMQRPIMVQISDVYRNVDPLVAFFESIETFTPMHETGWYII